MDMLSIFGVIIAFSALIGGNFLEGGSWRSLINGSAALIVIGGTLGAAMLQTPKESVKRALNLFSWIFIPPRVQNKLGIDKIIAWSVAVRRDGLLALENLAEREADLFSRKGLQMLVDGNDPDMIRHVLETDLLVAEKRDFDAVNFYECMGGYAPTIGIIGAVLGLIHVMRHLTDPALLGPGIAVAFVATIYGVAFANLLLLPVANKLRLCVKEKSQYRELMIEGILAIADGENPKAIEMKLSGYLMNPTTK
jgi:chemotaxis protein MotA